MPEFAEFIVHSIPGSPFGRSVLAVLEEKRARYRLSALTPEAFRMPEHLARHPFGRVPVLEHGGFTLYETQAILRYLDRILSTSSLTPSDPKAAARMEQLMNVSDWYLFQGVGNVIAFQRIIGPRLMGATTDEGAIDAVMPKARLVVNELARFLGDQPFFVGDTVSLADFHLAPQIDFFAQTPEWLSLSESHPNLIAWLARMEDRPSLRATTWERVVEMAKAA